MTPQARSLAWFRERGYLAETVEKWKRFPDQRKRQCQVCGNKPLLQIRSDLFGFCDILAIKALQLVPSGGTPLEGCIGEHIRSGDVVLCQVTDGSDHAKRLAKVIASAEAAICARAGVRIVIQSWRKVGARGKRKTWQMREDVLTTADFEEFGEQRPKLDDVPKIDSPMSGTLFDEAV